MTVGGPPTDPTDPTDDWQLDVEPIDGQETGDRRQETSDRKQATGEQAPHPSLSPVPSSPSPEVPPTPEQLVEAMLFVGGHPLTVAVACAAVRGLTPDRFLVAVDALTRKYRRQRRPYAIHGREDGFVLTVLPSFRALRDRIFGGPREARLSQPALDVLAVVAYRQPVEKGEVDAIRGMDSARSFASSSGSASSRCSIARRPKAARFDSAPRHDSCNSSTSARWMNSPDWGIRRRCRHCHTPRTSG